MTQPPWSARSQSARELIPPAPPPSRDVNLTFSLSGILVLLLAGLILRLAIAYLIFPGKGFDNDVNLYAGWAQTLADHGPAGFYGNAGWTDYTPGYLYVLWLLGALGNVLASPLGMPADDVIRALLKLPAILADVALAGLLYRAASRWHSRRAGLWAAALYLFIPVTWYDSAMWGQMDAVGALLLVAMALLLIDGWDEPATALAMLAAVVKPQFAIGLLVVAGVVVGRYLLGRLPELSPRTTGFGAALDRRLGGWFTERHGPSRLLACAITGVVVFLLLILPFDLQRVARADLAGIPVVGQVAGFFQVIFNAADYYRVLTANAFNGWALAGPAPLSRSLETSTMWTYDSQAAFGLTAAQVGTLAFAAIALTVMGALAWRSDRTAIVLGLTVLAIAFFAIPTRVHERYLFPAFAIGALMAAASVGWRWWYLALGLANAVNLHAILTLPRAGYAPSMQGLPWGDEARSETTIIVVAIVVSAALIVALAAFVWKIAGPAFSEAWGEFRAWYVATSGPPAATAPAPEAEFKSWIGESPAGAAPPKRSIGRTEFGIAALLVLLTFGFRFYQLGTPRGMYFDEVWHAGTATEFLQDWRYGMPHDISEWTHPHLGKYFMAGSIALIGNNRVTSTETLAWPVTDAAFEPTYLDPRVSGGKAGDRVVLTTGSAVLIAEHGQLDKVVRVPLAGARTVAVDTSAHRTFVGTTDGTIWEFTSEAFDELAAYGTVPQAARVASVGSEVTSIRPAGFSSLLVQSGSTLRLIDLTSGSVTWHWTLPAVTSIETYNIDGTWVALMTTPDGLIQLDPTNLSPLAQISILGGANGVDLVYGSALLDDWRGLLPEPTLYVATGTARMEIVTFGSDGKLVDRGSFAMPGTVTDVAWNRATNLVHVLGKTRDGAPTVFVVDPVTNSTFADAQLLFTPVAWIVDAQPNDPGTDRERVLAFSLGGTYSAVDAGSNAFAWRLPAVVAGALLAGLLYLLTMLLFRRRSVGLLLAALISMDGLIFGRSRIAGVDVYLALFIVAAFLFLAYRLQSGAKGKRAVLEGLLLPPLIGLLLGLAVATKWPGVYAIGAAVLIVLLRSGIGRWLALAGMIGLTGILGYQALDGRPVNSAFALLLIGLTVLLAVGIVRAGPIRQSDGPRWVDPRWGKGLPFAWAMACLLLIPVGVYVASYIPWALSAGGSPQLFPGWPAGHAGETLWDLQARMYAYHNEFRYAHGASSPWWAWPLDLKPVWAYLDTMLGGSQATVIEAGNPFLFWLSVPAAAFGMWQAWSRRHLGLAFVSIAAVALWLPWARIDRVTFDYHYYPTLLFVFVLLAYFLAELWEGPSRRTWQLARLSVALALLAPALLWVVAQPLCTAGGVHSALPLSRVCNADFGDWPVWVTPWLAVGAAICVAAWRFIKPRQLVGVVLIAGAITFAVMYPFLSAWQLPSELPFRYSELLPTWDSSFLFGHNALTAAKTPIAGVGTAVTLIVTIALVIVGMVAAGWRLPRVRIRFGRGGGDTIERRRIDRI